MFIYFLNFILKMTNMGYRDGGCQGWEADDSIMARSEF